VLVVQREERVHIRQALAQLAVDRAKEVEREAELEHELVRHHEVPDAHLPSYDPLRGEQHDPRERGAEDDVLPAVQERERRRDLHARALVRGQRAVVLRNRVRLVPEVLDGLEVQQAVDGDRRCAVIRLVRFAPEPRAMLPSASNWKRSWGDEPPGRRAHSEPGVCAHGRKCDRGKVPPKVVCLGLYEHTFSRTTRSLTRMPHTSVISSAVGTMRNRIACRRNVMPLRRA
jgi:hypothetical protein